MSYLVIAASLIILHLSVFNIPGNWSVWVFTALLAGVILTRSWTVFHLSITLVLWSLMPYVLPAFVRDTSAVSLLIVFLTGTLATRLLKPAHGNLEWLRKGRINRFSFFLIAATAILSGIALILWATWTDNLGRGAWLVQQLSDYPKALILLIGVPGFAILNAFSEEVIFRGVFQQAFQKVFDNIPAAITLQAAAFAALHFVSGFPNGVSGYLMTFAYGTMIGYIRHRTGGILAPIIVHIVSDLVIGYYLCLKFL